MTQATTETKTGTVRVAWEDLVAFTARVFGKRGVADEPALAAAEALVYGDLTGVTSHGLVNLTRLYLKLFDDRRVNPAAQPRILADRGAAVVLDADLGLGLWVASEAMTMATERAAEFGVGMVSVLNSTHIGCAGYHATQAVSRRMIGLIASNCGRQRIIRPPGGTVPLLGTNPFSIASPAGPYHPYVLDMSTTVVPTGRVRAAARADKPIPEGWLETDDGRPVTDPHAFDRGEAHLMWLGGRPETGAYKGYGLGLLVEVLGALLPGAGMGPAPEALLSDPATPGRDDNIGFMALAISPGTLRSGSEFENDAASLFGTLLDCPPVSEHAPVRYPGWYEAEQARHNRASGVPLDSALYEELVGVADDLGLIAPSFLGRK
jgi:LDH2 family malate/lactate/ureidoglycolate dehydrogenase